MLALPCLCKRAHGVQQLRGVLIALCRHARIAGRLSSACTRELGEWLVSPGL
jgi:hypothetical protein